MEPQLADSTRHTIHMEEKVKLLEEELLLESEKRAKFQREAALNTDKVLECERLYWITLSCAISNRMSVSRVDM